MNQRDVSANSKAILEYWFSNLDDRSSLDKDTEPFRSCFERWYGKRKEVDDEIRARFEGLLLATTQDGSRWQDELTAWARVPNGLLALIILLDQFPRNMYRDSPGMYAHDPPALAVCAMASGDAALASLPLIHRMFLYLPLLHAENRTLQGAAVEHFRALRTLASERCPHNVGFFAIALDFAEKHEEAVAKFGRFPHRNAILGRSSSAEEIEYLKHAPGF